MVFDTSEAEPIRLKGYADTTKEIIASRKGIAPGC